MFSQTAQWYDKIYLSMKDYRAEADKLTAIIREHRCSPGNRLLDVACGPWSEHFGLSTIPASDGVVWYDRPNCDPVVMAEGVEVQATEPINACCKPKDELKGSS